MSPLVRITSPPEMTDEVVAVLHQAGAATDISVLREVSHPERDDLILAEIPRDAIDELLAVQARPEVREALVVAIQPSEVLSIRGHMDGDDAVIWAQVAHDVRIRGRRTWVNGLLVVLAAMIASIGIMQDQLLLIVGAMALSPDFFPIADTCLAFLRRAWRDALTGMVNLVLMFTWAAIGAWVLTEILVALGVIETGGTVNRQFVLFISDPDALSVVVALIAGVAGALSLTLPDARGLVGVFVSVTTIPAAANIGVALTDRDPAEMRGAAVQLAVNVLALLVAGTVTLVVRYALSSGPRSLRPLRKGAATGRAARHPRRR